MARLGRSFPQQALRSQPPPALTDPLGLPAAFGQQQDLARAAPRAAADAYLVAATFPVGDYTQQQGYAEAQTRISRAAPSAYSIHATFPVGDETAGFVRQPDVTPRAAPRPAAAAYDAGPRPIAAIDASAPPMVPAEVPRAANRVPRSPAVTDRITSFFDPGIPPASGRFEPTPTRVPRPAQEAYQTPVLRPWDQQPVAWGSFTERARAAQRLSGHAWWTEPRVISLDLDRPAGQGSQTEFARPPRRAGLEGYLPVVPKTADEPALSQGHVSQPLARRAGGVSPLFFSDRPAALDSSAPPPAVAEFVRIPTRRVAGIAFELLATPVALMPELPEGERGQGVSPASAPRLYASRVAFAIDGIPIALLLGTPPIAGIFAWPDRATAVRSLSSLTSFPSFVPPADPPFPGQLIFPFIAPRAARPAATAYTEQILPRIADPPCPGALLWPDRAPALPRAAGVAYRELLPRQTDENLPQFIGWLPDSAKPPRRAPATAYDVPPRSDAAGESAPAAWGYVTPSARGPSRAAIAVYALTLSPTFPEPCAFGFQALPQRRPPAAGVVAYSLGVAPQRAEETGPLLWSLAWSANQPRRASRAAPVAYGLDQRFAIVGLDQPAAWGYAELQRRRIPRPSIDAYLLATRFTLLDLMYADSYTEVYGGSGDHGSVFGSSGAYSETYGETKEANTTY